MVCGSICAVPLETELHCEHELLGASAQAFCDERGVPVSARRAQDAAAAELALDAQMRGFFRFSKFSHRCVMDCASCRPSLRPYAHGFSYASGLGEGQALLASKCYWQKCQIGKYTSWQNLWILALACLVVCMRGG